MEDSAAAAEDGRAGSIDVSTLHINKRSLKKKSLSLSFNEKDLKDFVGGFHKRKKKRRREALQKQEEAERRKRIELRKKRKLEREMAYGGATADSDGETADNEDEVDGDDGELPSVSGTMTYDKGDVQVVVTTSEIGKENKCPDDKPSVGRLESEKSKQQKVTVIRKKLVKKAPKKRRSHAKTQSKRDKRMGKRKNKKQ